MEVIMTDIDFVEIKICGMEFPESRVLLCTLPVVKAAKSRVAREYEPTTTKQQILGAYRRCVYFFTGKAYERRSQALLKLLENDFIKLLDYFEDD